MKLISCSLSILFTSIPWQFLRRLQPEPKGDPEEQRYWGEVALCPADDDSASDGEVEPLLDVKKKGP